MKKYHFNEMPQEVVDGMSAKERCDYYDKRNLIYSKNRFHTRISDGFQEVLKKAADEFVNDSIQISNLRKEIHFVEKEVIDPYHYLKPAIYKNVVEDLLTEIDKSIIDYSPIEKIEAEIKALVQKLIEANRSLHLEENKNG